MALSSLGLAQTDVLVPVESYKAETPKQDSMQFGHVDILVSQDGLPKEGARLFIDGKEFNADSMGFVSQTLSKGRHVLVVEQQNGNQHYNQPHM